MDTMIDTGVPAMSFTSGYSPPVAAFDEMKSADGLVRPHWQPLMQHIEALGEEGLRDCHESAIQLLREHGVTYTVNSDGESAERTWKLDVLPLVIDAAEWAGLEAGLIQRTRLLNHVLADIYGPQNLLRDGLLPPALLHANPGFFRCCHGIRPPRDVFLSIHAVDLTREPDGRWWVLRDSTQAPSGFGYALENRAILSRILSNEFRNCQMQRLGGFIAQRKAGLLSLAPWTDTPHIVVLTPGPYAETYFEHVYLARHLGYPLVEGSDLTVRNRRVYLKTLEGLQPIDLIIRRVDDTWSDPLELRPDSILGVPGLVDAARAGNVAISNALGSGAVETPAILAFLPALARNLLGEKLLIPNVATWWCGQERECNYVLGSLGSLVIKRAFGYGGDGPDFGESLSPSTLGSLAESIRANPHGYVGQEHVDLSTAPVWNGRAFEPRPLILRCYICATPDGYTVMPGGLTRVSPSVDSPIVSSRFGGGSKDTWVCSTESEDEQTVEPPPVQPAKPGRSTARVPSRLVENLFWIGRYAERLEDTTRILRTMLGRLAGEGGPIENLELEAMNYWLAHSKFLPKKFSKQFVIEQLSAEVHLFVFDRDKFGSIRELIGRLAFLATCVRDRLSGDTWRILNQLQSNLPPAEELDTPGLIQALHRVIFQLAAFNGMEMENMTRGQGWLFLDIGRRLERSVNLIANIRSIIATGARAAALPPLLECTDSTMTYRRQYLARPEIPETFVLLLSDETNPRSLAFQFNALRGHLSGLEHSEAATTAVHHFQEIDALLAGMDVFQLTASSSGDYTVLERCLEELYEGSRTLSDLISEAYFSHIAPRIC
jgi:uncharacterized circularly permuted ATP-grasp superfamily protein/uncharacterized alpha-E superfamily protein